MGSRSRSREPVPAALLDGHTMMAHFREMLRSEIKEPMAKDFADVKTSIDNVRRDVERHEGRPNSMEQELKDLREGRSVAPSTAASSVGPPLRFSGLESAARSAPSGPKKASDKICVTIGGWDRDTRRDTIPSEARAFTDTIPDKAEDGVFVPLERASFLKVIRLSMMITRAKKEMIDNLGVQTADLELDYIRGVAWWKQHRFGKTVKTTGLMSFRENVAAEISTYTGADLNPVEFQAKANAGQRLDRERTLEEPAEQMGFKFTSWDAQGIGKHSAEFFAQTLREQHDYDLAIFQEVGHSRSQREDSMDELSDLITVAPSGAHPIVGAARWVGDFPVGQRTRRADLLARLLMQRDLAATNTFIAAASGPTCHCDFKCPPSQIDYVLTPARDIWKVSTALEDIADCAQSDHSAIKLELTLGARRRYVWNGGRAPMKGWTCLDNRFQRWSHNACYADRNPVPITSMMGAVRMAAAARGRGPPAREAPKLPESHEFTQTLRTLEARRRATRDRVQRAIYSRDIKIRAANRALQHDLHEAGNPRELLERECGNAFRTSDGEGPEDALDIPPLPREALDDMEAMKAPGVGGVVAEVAQALDSGFLASLAAVFESRFRGVPEHARDQVWSKHIIQPMEKKGDKHTLKGYRPIALLTTFEKL
ncbi:unnamed protein product [Prorocentrum cordatum]|uniref:Endonuclease/exonuclease/phosphatase domain-containing protein n=1 Tax=Prorocentrum cordatum TaxID=2364126 RepID=A0ABN9VC91_9DINO|nr:unnamed protein product [Polarella glacialis]